MQRESGSELRGGPTPSSRKSPSDRSSGLSRRGCNPRESASVWVWLLLWALAAPGVRGGLTPEEEEMVIELHNHYRGLVFPPASAMMPLKWDPSLRLLAEGYAAKCMWNHNPELIETGENLFATDGLLDLRSALEQWFLEHIDYNINNNSCPEDKMCGHYTQMVWADTHKVGCAVHLCDSMDGLDFRQASFLVCNYYPAGNYDDQKPYEEGTWCSRCPGDLTKCENHLCVPDTDDPTTTTGFDTTDPHTHPPDTADPHTPPPDTADPHTPPPDTAGPHTAFPQGDADTPPTTPSQTPRLVGWLVPTLPPTPQGPAVPVDPPEPTEDGGPGPGQDQDWKRRLGEPRTDAAGCISPSEILLLCLTGALMIGL